MKTGMSRLILSITVWIFLFSSGIARTVPDLPPPLKPWQEWALHGKETRRWCIPRYNDGNRLQCAWPTALALALSPEGGTFSQTWEVQWDTWAALPGSSRHWPQAVRVNGSPRPVLEQDNAPAVRLTPGVHIVTGAFSWTGLPDHIRIPPASGLVSLNINNEHIPFPDFDDMGRLWLKRTRTQVKTENRLKLESFRLIDDAIPARMAVRLTLDVAGIARQMTLGPVYAPDRFTPLSLDSPLPARLEQDGRLRIQARPGRYTIRLDLRHGGPLNDLAFTLPDDSHWPSREIWSFKARPDLRLVEIQGIPAIDPSQTSMPPDWHGFPAFMIAPGKVMTFREIKRGDPSPSPDQLSLDRDLWLRFDGTGVTVRDRIRGTKHTGWRLEMDPALALGRVTVDGREQLITRRGNADRAGIELRNGRVNLTAVSTGAGSPSRLPATGWDHDFQNVSGRLHLPPGWKLIHASGMDRISRTWTSQWTLLDFFIVLIFTIALARLYSKSLSAVAFITLVLVFHEPNAPKYIWLVLLTGFALLKYLPRGRFRTMVRLCQGLALLAFFFIVIPYGIQALRVGFFPQLERPWISMGEYRQTARQMAAMDAVQEMAVEPESPDGGAVKRKSRVLSTPASSEYGRAPRVMQYDPGALTQTGPGLPGWQPFETVTFSWSGPVSRNQTVGFTLIGPKINLTLAAARVVFIILLFLGMLGIRYRPGKGMNTDGLPPLVSSGLIPSLLVPSLLVFVILLLPAHARAGEIPSQEMLDQLAERLLRQDDCFPACADMPRLDLKLTPEHLSMTARIDARTEVAVPLPGHGDHWLPGRVHLDGIPAQGIFREKDTLWVRVPRGMHTLTLEGQVRTQNAFQLPFRLRPRHLKADATGWTVEGIHPDGSFDQSLQFKRLAQQRRLPEERLDTGVLPPFARVERTLLLGLTWKVTTRVQRVSPAGSGMVMDIPLIPGESVTTPGVRVENQRAKINFRADQTSLVWESVLDRAGTLRLTHADTNAWTEVWQVDVSPVFHLDYSGIPVILHKTGNRWFPTWHPWPGETVDLQVTQPAGVEGPTLTIERTHMQLTPGRHATHVRMDMTVKSSQGGQHAITLPDGARLQEVTIQGKIQPIRQTGTRVVLPIVPGTQEIRITWQDAGGISPWYASPRVDLGSPSVNASVDIRLPRNRWPLFVGGDLLMGPAVLFWSVLIIIFIVAFGLSRSGWTPLKFRHWFLLCIGMSMSHLGAGILVAGWLIALDFRGRASGLKGGRFNLVQAGLLALTLAAAACLVFAISNGLLGHPDMNIRGNGSSSGLLRWYHDAGGPVLPRAWVISIPMLAYRAAMLAWALWTAFWLTGILRWGWQQFSTPRLWDKMSIKIKRPSMKKQTVRPEKEKPADKGRPQ